MPLDLMRWVYAHSSLIEGGNAEQELGLNSAARRLALEEAVRDIRRRRATCDRGQSARGD